MSEKKSVFATLNAIDDFKEHIEEKNRLKYLSWAWAWMRLKVEYPDASYTVYENEKGWNYFTDGRTAWVKVGVTVEGLEHVEYLPVMDNRNQSIPLDKITSMNVNKSIQRALTKAIARHGLGLFIYAGEDIPEDFVERLGKRSNDIYKKFLKEGNKAESIKECMKKAAKAFEADNNPNEVPVKDEEEYNELVAQLLRENANQQQQSEVE
jgi:hypothetical protein